MSAVAAEVVEAQVICKDENDIGWSGLFFGLGSKGGLRAARGRGKRKG